MYHFTRVAYGSILAVGGIIVIGDNIFNLTMFRIRLKKT